MIGEWMLYAGVVSACAACVAAAAEPWLRARRMPGRWVWTSVFAMSVLVPIAVGMRPRAATVIISSRATAVEPEPTASRPGSSGSDGWLSAAWGAGSLLVAGALIVGLAQLARARRRAVRETWAGTSVGITEELGPGAAPFGEPRILVPRWVQRLTPEGIRLLLAHEEEHVRAGDARMLLGATLVVAVLPWNVALWWSLKRLRTAIELDCDARVLQKEPSVGAYARLLLDVAGRARTPATPALLAFAHSTSQLRTRIDAMTMKRSLSPVGRVATGTLALVAIAVACETRRPEPVAPVTDFVLQDGRALPTRLTGDPADSAAVGALRFVSDVDGDPNEPVLIVMTPAGKQSFAGRLRRASKDPMGGLPPDQIQSIEVIKRREVLPPTARGGLIVITLKEGATWRPGAR